MENSKTFIKLSIIGNCKQHLKIKHKGARRGLIAIKALPIIEKVEREMFARECPMIKLKNRSIKISEYGQQAGHIYLN